MRGQRIAAQNPQRPQCSTNLAVRSEFLYYASVGVVQTIDLEEVRAFLRRKREKRRDELASRLRAAQGDAERIMAHIAAVHRPKRIWQWGSLVDTGHFSEISDIDIAVEGMKRTEDWFAIVGDAMRMTGFPLDIIEIEKVDGETADLIRRRGRLVHERHGDA